MTPRTLPLFLFASLGLVACGSSSDSAPVNPTVDSGASDTVTDVATDAPVGTPAIRFFTKPSLAGTPVEATKSFWADVIVVRVSGVPAHASVTLTATTKLRDGLYSSNAVFEADAAGTIDTERDAPTAGTWDEADPDGITWSMTKTTVTSDPPIAQWAMLVDATIDGGSVAHATIDRYLVDPTITRVPVNEGGIVGVYYAPADGKKHPTILAFGGSEGGLVSGESDAAYFSALGYAALGVAYFASPGVPDDLANIPLEYFQHSMEWLDGRAEADATKLGVIGGSRGGELALLLGATFPRVKAVVAQLPSGVSWGGFGNGLTEETFSWTLGGVGIPYVPGSASAVPKSKKDTDGKLIWSYTPTFDAALDEAPPAQLEAAKFAVEKTQGPVLMIAGGDDQLWPSCRLGKIAMDKLADHTKTWSDELECYPDAGHNVLMPGSPTMLSTRALHPISKQWLALGGTPKGIAKASRDADTKIRALFARALK